MSRPFTVTAESVREWITTTDRRHAEVLAHVDGGPLPVGRTFVSGMEASDARAWQDYDARKKIAVALMNLRPRDLYTQGGVCHDRNKWMDVAIPAMVEELIESVEGVPV